MKRKTKPVTHRYRVYVAQINQDYVEVEAFSKEEASEKGYAKWRRDYAHSNVRHVAQIADS